MIRARIFNSNGNTVTRDGRDANEAVRLAVAVYEAQGDTVTGGEIVHVEAGGLPVGLTGLDVEYMAHPERFPVSNK